MSNTTDQYTLLTTEEEKREYAEKEKQKPLILKWIEKFRLCKTAEELSRTAVSYCRSVLFQRNGISKASTRQTKTETATESTSKTDWKKIIGVTLAVGGVMFFWLGIPTIIKRAEKRKGK